jgi:hypothetical protein
MSRPTAAASQSWSTNHPVAEFAMLPVIRDGKGNCLPGTADFKNKTPAWDRQLKAPSAAAGVVRQNTC